MSRETTDNTDTSINKNHDNDEGVVSEGSGSSNDSVKNVSDLPQWAQDELSRARANAASYRTRLRETEGVRDELQASLDAETEKSKGLMVERDDAKLFGLKLDAALEAQVPGDALKVFADRLRGNTVEELKRDAETLKNGGFGVAPLTGRATDLSAGLGNNKPSTPEDMFGSFVGSKLGWGT